MEAGRVSDHSDCGFAARESYGTSSSHRPDPASRRRLADLEPLAELGVRAERPGKPPLGGIRRSDLYGRGPLFTLLTTPWNLALVISRTMDMMRLAASSRFELFGLKQSADR